MAKLSPAPRTTTLGREKRTSLTRRLRHQNNLRAIPSDCPRADIRIPSRRTARFFSSIFARAVLMSALAEGKRVTLVIGNSAYKHAAELSNPWNDALNVAASLKAFTVITEFDLNHTGLRRTAVSSVKLTRKKSRGEFPGMDGDLHIFLRLKHTD
jgi:hypothetical protein